MQLNHPGRQVPKFLNDESVAPSAVGFGADLEAFFAVPRELSGGEVGELVERFGESAALAESAGFDGVQIHGAHGYLVSQFLSPTTNRRDDEWGGDEERRRRFVTEVYREVRRRTSPGFGVAIKINSADFQKGGITEDESARTIVALAAEGMDFIEVSGGTYEAPAMVRELAGETVKESTKQREAYFLRFAEALRERLDKPLVVTGGFRSGSAMAAAIDSGAVDMVGLARTLAIAPDLPERLLSEGDVRIDLPPKKTGIAMIDRMGMTELTWYERQLHRMGRGKDPKPDESGLYATLAHLVSMGPAVFRTRRAR